MDIPMAITRRNATAPDSRSGWHVHGGMYVIGVGGVGLYQEEGKPAIIIRKGDVIQILAGVKHWHGSTKDSWFQQIVFDVRNVLASGNYYKSHLDIPA